MPLITSSWSIPLLKAGEFWLIISLRDKVIECKNFVKLIFLKGQNVHVFILEVQFKKRNCFLTKSSITLLHILEADNELKRSFMQR